MNNIDSKTKNLFFDNVENYDKLLWSMNPKPYTKNSRQQMSHKSGRIFF